MYIPTLATSSRCASTRGSTIATLDGERATNTTVANTGTSGLTAITGSHYQIATLSASRRSIGGCGYASGTRCDTNTTTLPTRSSRVYSSIPTLSTNDIQYVIGVSSLCAGDICRLDASEVECPINDNIISKGDTILTYRKQDDIVIVIDSDTFRVVWV
jgi:hypothetical protein